MDRKAKKKLRGDAALKAIKSGDAEAIEAIIEGVGQERDARVQEGMAKMKIRGALGRTEEFSFDPNEAALNGELGRQRLIEFRNTLSIGQMALADVAQVSQTLISAIERGEKPFTEPSRTKIWKAIFWMQAEKAKRDAEENPSGFASGDPLANFRRSMTDFTSLMGLNKTPMERKDEEIRLLQAQNECYRKEAEFSRQLLNMDLVNRCVELEKQLAAALEANAEYAKLFALKGAAVAGDELQEKIEQRVKRKGEV